MTFTATVYLSLPGLFEERATYRGELGAVRGKALQKIRQTMGRLYAIHGARFDPREALNWGDSVKGRLDDGAAVAVSSAIRVDMRGR